MISFNFSPTQLHVAHSVHTAEQLEAALLTRKISTCPLSSALSVFLRKLGLASRALAEATTPGLLKAVGGVLRPARQLPLEMNHLNHEHVPHLGAQLLQEGETSLC